MTGAEARLGHFGAIFLDLISGSLIFILTLDMLHIYVGHVDLETYLLHACLLKTYLFLLVQRK